VIIRTPYVTARDANLKPQSRTEKEGIMKWLLVVVLTSSGLVSAQAYTCDDVRSLSQEQRAYYIKVFSITLAQQQQIRRACSEPRMRHASVSDGTTTHFGRSDRFGHAERDARPGQ
jgi:hypothetical protein